MELERLRLALRRAGERRERTRGHLADVRRGNVVLRRALFGALLAWAFIATVATVALIGQSARDAHTARQAAQAVRRDAEVAARSARALAVSTGTVNRLQAEVSGACFRLNYLRWQLDRVLFDSWQRDREAALFLSRIPSRRPRPLRRLARVFHRSAVDVPWLPVTDCAKATSDPIGYRPPAAPRLHRLPLSSVTRALAHPPAGPSTP